MRKLTHTMKEDIVKKIEQLSDGDYEYIVSDNKRIEDTPMSFFTQIYVNVKTTSGSLATLQLTRKAEELAAHHTLILNDVIIVEPTSMLGTLTSENDNSSNMGEYRRWEIFLMYTFEEAI